MQINPQPCCRKNGGLLGLGAGTGAAVGTAVGSAYGPIGGAVGGAIGGAFDGGGSSSPSGSGAASPTGGGMNVSPSIAVSPQISPSFVQQWQPSNSGVTTGAAMIGSGGATSMPAPTGQSDPYGAAYPGSNIPASQLPMSVNAAIPTVQASQQWASMLTAALPWLIGGAVVIVGIRAFKRRA